MSAPKVLSITPLPVPHEVVYLYLYWMDGLPDGEFETHRDPVLGMAILDRDPDDGQLDYLVHEGEYHCPVSLSEFMEHGTNRYVIGVYPVGVDPQQHDVDEAKNALREQVRQHRADLKRRIAKVQDAA